MDDLRRRFAGLDALPVPDVWSDVERRLAALDGPAGAGRLVVVRPEWGPRAERSRPSPARAGGRRSTWLVLAAALIAVAVVGGVLAVGSGLVRLPSIVPPSPGPTRTQPPLPTPSVPEPSPSPSAAPTPPPIAFRELFPEIRDVRLLSDRVGWLATGSAIYRSADTGRTWVEVRRDGVTAASVTAFVDADTMYVLSGRSPASIAATHDGGITWVDTTLDIGAIDGGPIFSFRSPSHGFATFFGPDGSTNLAVYATDDGGRTWTGPRDGGAPPLEASLDKLDDPLGGYFSQRSGKFDNRPFDNRFFLSADGAASWTEHRFPTGPLAPAAALKEIVAIAGGDGGPITMAIAVSGVGAVYEATADPSVWHLVRQLPGPDVQMLSPTTWVVAMSGAEFRSTVDAGAHWQTRATAIPFRNRPRFATPDVGWVTVGCNPDSILPQDRHCDGTTTEGMLLVTEDGGATWTRLDR
jgi:hypothetical protein